MQRHPPNSCTLPVCAGIGLRFPHHAQVLQSLPAIGWLEVHSENFFADGGPNLALLQRLRAHYPISLHGVGLSLGATAPLDQEHLRRLRRLAQRIEPAAVSEHLCWSAVPGRCLNELLPLPYSREALDHVCTRIAQAQDALGRTLLVENVSSYLQLLPQDMPEWEFLARMVQRTGCALLLDINNVHVSAHNHGFDAYAYVDALPPQAVQEIHLAGYETEGPLLLDTHSRPVHSPVWALYRHALQRMGARPTLIEWDQDLPELDVLLQEAEQAQHWLDALGDLPAVPEARHACPA